MDASKKRAPTLRKRAEESLQGLPLNLDDLSLKDVQNLFHELQVHQIELELQNDELRKTQDELETARRKYSDLYEFAPVGYFTLNQAGVIEEVNLAGAALLGAQKSHLISRAFSEFVHLEDQDIYYLNLRKFFGTPATYTAHLRVLKSDDTPIAVHLVCIIIQNDELQARQCLELISKMSDHAKMEA